MASHFTPLATRHPIARTVAAILAALPFQGFAATGNELLEDCKEAGANWSSGYCLGLIVGFAYGYDTGRSAGAMVQWNESTDGKAAGPEATLAVGNSAKYYCIPEAVTNGQLLDVVVKFLEGNPATRHLPAQILIWTSLKQSFPCQ